MNNKIKRLYQNDQDIEEQNQESIDFEKMLLDSEDISEKRLRIGDKIRTEILSIGKEKTIVSTGTRFDGIIPTETLLEPHSSNPSYRTGDILELYVMSIKGAEVHLAPSPSGQKVSNDLESAFQSQLPVEGCVESVNKGGYQVLVKGKRAFCPFSQIDLIKIEDPESFCSKKLEFLITEYDEKNRNIVLSRRKLLEEGIKSQINGKFVEGSVVTGKVTRLEDFGAFVEIAPQIEGLAHISELSWSRIQHPSELLKMGQDIKVKILKIEQDQNKRKISLSLKKVEGDPWEQLPSHLREGQIISGTITRCMSFGAFVELHPGVEGLIPLSQFSNTKKTMRAEEFVNPGDSVSVLIKRVDLEAQRISLSYKEAQEQEALVSEAEDLKHFREKQAQQNSSSSSDLALKLQAALSKKQNK